MESPATELQKVELPVLDDKGNPTGETIIEVQGVETGEMITGWQYKEKPEYDHEQPYIERKDRPEWAAVGMLGVLSVRDDGTGRVNGYVRVAEDGTATAVDEYIPGVTYRVIRRMSDTVVQVIFR